MKLSFFAILFMSFIVACNTASKNQPEEIIDVIYQSEDKEILDQVFQLFAKDTDTPISELIVKVGEFFKETPYVGHTLETENEQLIVNLRELDCTTFAENCLAISKTIKSGEPTFEQFASELQNIRYRNGILDGYPSRLHYFSDWIYDNQQKKLIDDVSQKIAEIPYRLSVNFMSTHPESYLQLKDNSELVQVIAEQEKEISSRNMYYIPEENIAEMEDQLMDGDIAGITTGIEGLDISHVIILVRKEGRIHLMHASSAAEKVVVSDNTLEDYLLNSTSATGIIVARPL